MGLRSKFETLFVKALVAAGPGSKKEKRAVLEEAVSQLALGRPSPLSARCPLCYASPGVPCFWGGHGRQGTFHPGRAEAAMIPMSTQFVGRPAKLRCKGTGRPTVSSRTFPGRPACMACSMYPRSQIAVGDPMPTHEPAHSPSILGESVTALARIPRAIRRQAPNYQKTLGNVIERYQKTGDIESTWGTGGYGNTRPVTYARMVKAFGAPIARAGADDKIAFMWIFSDGEGNVLTIYDYKATRKYAGSLPSIEAFKKKSYAWNVGAGGPGGDKAAALFLRWVNTKLGGTR